MALFFGFSPPGTPSEGDYPLEEAVLLSKTLQLIKRNYVEPSRINPNKMFEAGLNEIQRNIPEILSQCFPNQYCTVTVDQAKRRFQYPGDSLGTLRARLRDIFSFMNRHVDADTEKKEIEYSAIDGLLAELDPHSNFLSPESYQEFQIGTEGEFGGLGIVIGLKEGLLTVMSPLEDTPAWKAGIKAGDQIIQIDEESTVSMTLTEAVQRLRGPVGSEVAIKITREGIKSPIIKKMARAVINIDAVQSKLVETPQKNKVGFIRVKSFQGNTERDFHEQLQQLTTGENKIKGVILDLRNNPGGLLDQAVTLSDEFLKEGTIVSTVGRNGTLIRRNKASLDGFEGDWPLVVLVNEGSASASEILAGALKNNRRAIVVGTRTFGKGSVQSVYRLPLGAALKITVAQYLTPGNQSIQSVGIAPDIELFPFLIDKEHLNLMENIYKTEKDLEKHLSGNGIVPDGKSLFRLGYLAPTPSKEEEEKIDYSNKLQLEKDIAVDVALNLMDVFSKADREEMVQEAKSYLKTREALEDKKIVEEFGKMGVNWNVALADSRQEEKEAKGNPLAELSFQILKEGKELKRAPAGETITLQLKLKNVGSLPFQRLVAQTDSENFLFKNIEFAFGKVLPNEIKSWETHLEIPKASLTEDAEMTLHFQEKKGKAPADVSLVVPIQALERPLFTHRYEMEKDWSEKLKNGKSAKMKLEIMNIGKGKALKPVVILKNLNGKEVFIEKGRVALEPIEPKDSAQGELYFHIDPSWFGKTLRLELSILDADLLVGTKQKLIFQTNTETLEPSVGQWYRPPDIQIASQTVRVDETPHLLQGTIEDDQTVRDLFIFVDDKKAFYESNTEGKKTIRFQSPLPLKEGSNTIAITARDNFNLVSQQFLVLQYHPAPMKKNVAEKKGRQL